MRDVCLLMCAMLLSASSVHAAVPAQVPVQGTLRDNAGQPVMEGAFRMTVSLYASEDATEVVWQGSWPEDPVANCVADTAGCVIVRAGAFRLNLPVTSEFFAAGNVWLGLQVEEEPELPRRRLGTTPYAFHAASAAGLACSGCVTSEALSAEAIATVAAAAAAEVQLAPPTLGSVSEGLLTHAFVDTFTYPGVIAIPDNFPPGLTVTLEVADVGVAEAVRVHVVLTNSNISTVSLSLTDPNGAVHLLYDGAGEGAGLEGTWPTSDALVSGDLGAWIGQNPTGTWSLSVVDSGFLNNAQDGEISAWSITVDTVSDTKVEAKADLIVTGSVQVGPSDAECVAKAAGTVAFDPASKSLMVCDGAAWLRLKTCDPQCPLPSAVTCGVSIMNACDDACSGAGTAMDPAACLGAVSTTACGVTVQDSCGNDCGLNGTAPSSGACPNASEVTCGQDISDACGNLCSGQGESCAVGSCLSGACCGDQSVDGAEECDDGNQVDGDGCSAQCQGEGVDYRGYITWGQDCSNQSDAQQDQMMNNACQSTYGGDARAATVEEIYSGAISGLPSFNNSGEHLLGTCPDCGGNSSGCVSGHCRKCVDPSAQWPSSSHAGWNTNCCNSSRSAICVD
jgi:cysteine-rich repeat protein